MNPALVFDNHLLKLRAGFRHHNLSARNHGNHRVGCLLNKFDLLAVDQKLLIVKAVYAYQLFIPSCVNPAQRPTAAAPERCYHWLSDHVHDFFKHLVCGCDDSGVGLKASLRDDHVRKLTCQVHIGHLKRSRVEQAACSNAGRILHRFS